jgi:hypothetical protein
MVESIYFLKPAWCGAHPAGLWPEQDFQSVTVATAFRRWFSLHEDAIWTWNGGKLPNLSDLDSPLRTFWTPLFVIFN